MTDAVTTEVFANLFKAIVDEMAWVVLRSSHTTFVKETQDFAVALVTDGGRDVRLALWQRRDHDDRHADARRHARRSRSGSRATC